MIHKYQNGGTVDIKEGESHFFRVTCSCGNSDEESHTDNVCLDIINIYERGWRTIGDTIYCPECAKKLSSI